MATVSEQNRCWNARFPQVLSIVSSNGEMFCFWKSWQHDLLNLSGTEFYDPELWDSDHGCCVDR